jgi:hypothetical protein
VSDEGERAPTGKLCGVHRHPRHLLHPHPHSNTLQLPAARLSAGPDIHQPLRLSATSSSTMASIQQQLPTARLTSPLSQAPSLPRPRFSAVAPGARIMIDSEAGPIEIGQMCDGWTDRVSPRPLPKAMRKTATATSWQIRFRRPSDEAIKMAEYFTSY